MGSAKAVAMAAYVKAEQQLSLHFPRQHGRSTDSMPLWWCPWVHDEALLAASASQGIFAATRRLRAAGELLPAEENNPTAVPAVEKLIRHVFFESPLNPDGRALCDNMFDSWDEAEEWLKARLERILMDLTEHLPVDHALRVRPRPLP